MGFTEQVLDDVRTQLAPEDTALKEARLLNDSEDDDVVVRRRR